MYLYVEPNLKLEQGPTNSMHLFARTTKYFKVAFNITGFGVFASYHPSDAYNF
jgi:hypothetical protein